MAVTAARSTQLDIRQDVICMAWPLSLGPFDPFHTTSRKSWHFPSEGRKSCCRKECHQRRFARTSPYPRKSAKMDKPFQKFSRVFEFSWESHEILMRKWHSHEKFPILMRISHEHFCSWECIFLILMSFFTGENLIFLTSVESSWESHVEILMRFSWENLTKTLFLLFLMNVSCNFLDQEILIENVVSWVFSISRERKYSMHARCVCERKPFRSSYYVHWSRDEVVHTGTCTYVYL